MKRSRVKVEPEQVCNGLQLYWYCHSLAKDSRKQFCGHPLLPSGARIFYYTRRLLLAQVVLPAVHPDEGMLSVYVVDRFIQAAPIVAERLAMDFAHAVRLRAEPGSEVKRLLSAPIPHDCELSSIPAPLVRCRGEMQQPCEPLWETCCGVVDQKHLVRLYTALSPARLPVAPVARLEDSAQVALRQLRDRLAQDAEREWLVPAAGAYLYDEPLETWLLRFLLIGPWCASLGHLWAGRMC